MHTYGAILYVVIQFQELITYIANYIPKIAIFSPKLASNSY
jgi:hypothetical protein